MQSSVPTQARARILVCDDSPTIRGLITELLRERYELLVLPSAEQALARAVDFSPDLIISDVMMTGMDGYALVQKIRTQPLLQHVPLILLTSKADDESRAHGLEVGADDYLFKPLRPRELIARVSSLLRLRGTTLELARVNEEYRKANERLNELVVRDGLTGLYNHRYFQERLLAELAEAKGAGRPLALLLLDIDHFKSINDTFGHPAGDQVLRQIARLLLDATGDAGLISRVRSGDVVARYGGEEFALLLPATPLDDAFAIAERIRKTVASHDFVVDGLRDPLRATVSIGAANYPDAAVDASLLLRCVDKALYRAKEEGRNRICTVKAVTS